MPAPQTPIQTRPAAVGHRVAPGLVHDRVLVVEELPAAGAQIEPAGAGGGRRPHRSVADHDLVDDVVHQAAVELGVGAKGPAGEHRQAAEGRDPEIAGHRIDRQGRDVVVGQPVAAAPAGPACRRAGAPDRGRCPTQRSPAAGQHRGRLVRRQAVSRVEGLEAVVEEGRRLEIVGAAQGSAAALRRRLPAASAEPATSAGTSIQPSATTATGESQPGESG